MPLHAILLALWSLRWPQYLLPSSQFYFVTVFAAHVHFNVEQHLWMWKVTEK
jgi:hypothetical protein